MKLIFRSYGIANHGMGRKILEHYHVRPDRHVCLDVGRHYKKLLFGRRHDELEETPRVRDGVL